MPNHQLKLIKGSNLFLSTLGPSPVVGFIREYGSEIRPSNDSELLQLIDAINSDSFSVDERLNGSDCLHTGARKQTILWV